MFCALQSTIYFDTACPLFRPCNHLANLSTTDSMNRKGNHLLKSARERERVSERPQPSNVRQKFSTETNRIHGGRRAQASYLDLEIGTITRECARRKQKKKQRKAESGEREREREERGEARMRVCLHLPVTSEGTSCLGLLSPGGHYYCFRLACSLLRLPFSLQSHKGPPFSRLPAPSSNMRARVGLHTRAQRTPRSLLMY